MIEFDWSVSVLVSKAR